MTHYNFILFLSKTKYILIIIKVQEKDERSFPQNTNPDQSKTRHPTIQKTIHKSIPKYLKLLNHKPKVS